MADVKVSEMSDEEALLDTLLSSFGYNRTEKHMVSIVLEIKGRLEDTFPCTQWSDDGNIIYGALVLHFGEYGTSPRSGWFESETKNELLRLIKEKLEYYKQVYNLSEEGE